MSRCLGIAALLVAFVLWPGGAHAQDAADGATPGPETADTTDRVTVDHVTMSAPVFEGEDDLIKASGGVSFVSGQKRATAQELTYDAATGTGKMLNARFTTCVEPDPHFYLSARSITLGAGNKVSTRGVSLTIFGLKVITLPSLSFRVGNRTRRSSLPLPGWDRRDGLTLGHTFSLMNTSRTFASAKVMLTQKHGYQFDTTAEYGIDGDIGVLPGRLPRYDRLQMDVRDVSSQDGPLTQQADPKASTLTAFGALSLRSRAFDLLDTNLIYFKRPEIGVDWTPKTMPLPGAKIDPQLRLLPEVVASWGRYAELPSPYGTVGRVGASLSLPVYSFRTSANSALQPILTYSWAHYSIGSTYRTYGWGVDYTTKLSQGSFLTLRYNQKQQSGFTPFEFDDLDIPKALDIGAQIRAGKHIYGFVGSMDATRGTLEDWEAIYGYRLDCLAGTVSWNGKFKQFKFGIELIGL